MAPPSANQERRPEEVTSSQLQSGLRALGIAPGMRVIVHASLRSLGNVASQPCDGGAGMRKRGAALTVVRALMATLTPQGTLLMPTFNHGAPFAPGGAGFFDPAVTPSESGAVSDVFWRQPDVYRSLHPTHSFACWGRGARELVAGHGEGSTLGPDSPLGRLTALGGFMLHLGTTHAASSIKHLVELSSRVPCLEDRRDPFTVVLPSGERTELMSWRYRAAPCPLTDSGEVIARALAARGQERHGRVGQGRASLVALQHCVETIGAVLSRGDGLAPPCSACSIRPGRREGDWGPSG